MTLYDKHGLDKAYCYNRKEKKDVGGPWLEPSGSENETDLETCFLQHGEGGDLVGAPLKGRIVIIDDVLTSGVSLSIS